MTLAVRCASSQMTRSIRARPPSNVAMALCTTSIDWYVEKMTTMRCSFPSLTTSSAITSGSVHDATGRSSRLSRSVSLSSLSVGSVVSPARVSEQTHMAPMGSAAHATQLRMLWLTRAIDGARNRMVCGRGLPSSCTRPSAVSSAAASAVSLWAMKSDVSVLPVPHAMTSSPRALPLMA